MNYEPALGLFPGRLCLNVTSSVEATDNWAQGRGADLLAVLVVAPEEAAPGLLPSSTVVAFGAIVATTATTATIVTTAVTTIVATTAVATRTATIAEAAFAVATTAVAARAIATLSVAVAT